MLRPPSPFEDFDESDSSGTGDVRKAEDYVGENSRRAFWKIFRTQSSRNRSKPPRPSSPRLNYLSKIGNLGLVPEPMGIVRRKDAAEIDLRSYRMGADYGKAFAESYAMLPGIEKVNLASNRIDDDTCARIIASMSNLQHIDLSCNRLGIKAATELQRTLSLSTSSIVSINLESNALNNRSISALCDGLMHNQILKRLNLSRSSFSGQGMESIGKLLSTTKVLEELYLSWNKIRGVGALCIVQAIRKQPSLRVLDLSWNSLASSDNRAVVIALADSVSNNHILEHFDISNNQFDVEDMGVLAKGMIGNHTLIGLHVSGNQGSVDAKGFIVPDSSGVQIQSQHKFCSIYKFEISEDNFPAHLWPYAERSCWYCGGWSEFQFTWTPAAVNVEIKPGEKVYLNLSIDDWKGDAMIQMDDKSYVLYRVLPPGKTQYFISVINPNDPTTQTRRFMRKDKHSSRLLRRPGDAITFGHLQRANYIEMPRTESRYPCDSTFPRRDEKNSMKKRKWELKKSQFAPRLRESQSRSFTHGEGFYAKAFAADWKLCKADRVVKNTDQRQSLENVCLKYFPKIVRIYQKYCGKSIVLKKSANSGPPDVASISWNGFVEFLNDCALIDDKCHMSAMENIFLAANLEVTTEAKELDNPDRSLTRFEFLECIFRIAIAKNTGKSDGSLAQAMEMLMKESILPHCDTETDEFRLEYIYHEEMDELLTENVVMLRDIYDTHMGRNCKAGDRKGMSILEALELFETRAVFDSQLRQQDLNSLFVLSMMLVTDEMATNDHKKLFFIEFFELLVRSAFLKYGLNRESTRGQVVEATERLLFEHLQEAEIDQVAANQTTTKSVRRLSQFGMIKILKPGIL